MRVFVRFELVHVGGRRRLGVRHFALRDRYDLEPSNERRHVEFGGHRLLRTQCDHHHSRRAAIRQSDFMRARTDRAEHDGARLEVLRRKCELHVIFARFVARDGLSQAVRERLLGLDRDAHVLVPPEQLAVRDPFVRDVVILHVRRGLPLEVRHWRAYDHKDQQ